MSLFGKKVIKNELEPPPIAVEHPEALELLRVWASTSGPHQIVLKKGFSEPGVWGIILADVARQAAGVYAADGMNAGEALARIRHFLNNELERPSSIGETFD